MQRIVLTRRGLASLTLAAGALATLGPARPAAAALPPAQQEIVRRVEAYFNGIATLAADFQQTAPDGGLSTGKLYIDRGRGTMRFDYDPPSKILLVAPGDWRLIFYDGSIKQVNVIPLAETPLGFVLDKEVRFGDEVAVQGARDRGEEIDLALVRTDEPDQGRVVLTLAKRPMELRRWAVTDPQGLTTTIVLNDVQTGIPLDRDLFVWRDPQLFGWPED
jgi:outer membrane lipoprotein-sorting protein